MVEHSSLRFFRNKDDLTPVIGSYVFTIKYVYVMKKGGSQSIIKYCVEQYINLIYCETDDKYEVIR